MEGAAEPRGSGDQDDDFEPLHLRPYVSHLDTQGRPAVAPDPAAYEPGGLLGPDGPLGWSIEDIWGPDERRSDAADEPGSDSDRPARRPAGRPATAEGAAGAERATAAGGEGGREDFGGVVGAEGAGDAAGTEGGRGAGDADGARGGARRHSADPHGTDVAHAADVTNPTHATDATDATHVIGSPHGLGGPHGSDGSGDRDDAGSSSAGSLAAQPSSADDLPDEPSGGRSMWRPGVLVAVCAVAVVAVVGLLVSGVFSYQKPSRESALPGSDASRSAPAQAGAGQTSPGAGTQASAPPASPSASASKSPPPEHTSTGTASAPANRPTARATGSVAAPPSAGHPTGPPVLRSGDTGAEVEELQLRLRQLLLFLGTADGTYSSTVETAVRNFQQSRDIEGDEPGVYGPATREKLESETRKP